MGFGVADKGGEVAGGVRDVLDGEFRDVEGVHEEGRPAGVLHGQGEGLAEGAVVIVVREIDAGVVGVVAAAGEGHPFACARP